MRHESMIERIKGGLKDANIETLGLLWETLRQSKQGRYMPSDKVSSVHSFVFNKKASPRKTSEFVGKNLAFEEIERLSVKERGELQRRLKERNQEWLRDQFTALNALWLMVIDGQVKSWGKEKK